MNWRDLECQTINPCICNSLYRNLFLINHYCLFVCLFKSFYSVNWTFNTVSVESTAQDINVNMNVYLLKNNNYWRMQKWTSHQQLTCFVLSLEVCNIEVILRQRKSRFHKQNMSTNRWQNFRLFINNKTRNCRTWKSQYL